jgi:hypothetical protein
VSKTFEFAESFLKPADGLGRLPKMAGAVLPAFQKRIVHQKHTGWFKTGKFALASFQKLFV